MWGPPISQSAWMVRRRVRRSGYSFGIFVKSLGSTFSLNCATFDLPSELARGGLLDPTHGFRARTAAAHAGKTRHRVDRFFERHLATRDLALQIGPVLHVDGRPVSLRQIREDVRNVLLDIRERFAVRPHHLVREFSAAAEEASVGKT